MISISIIEKYSTNIIKPIKIKMSGYAWNLITGSSTGFFHQPVIKPRPSTLPTALIQA